MLLAVHKTDWHKLTDAQRKLGTLEGEFLVLSANDGPGTWLKRQLAKVLPKRFQGCSGCQKRADWMDKAWNKIYMKWFIVLLLSSLTSFAQLKQTGWTTTTNAADARAALGITGGSQTPWTSDIDAAGYKLSDNGGDSYLQLSDGFSRVALHDDAGNGIDITSVGGELAITTDGGVRLNNSCQIKNESTDSFLDLTSAASTFGLNNGEPAGVGADINFVSANGNVVLNGAEISASSNPITNVQDPSNAQDAATKAYVDSRSPYGGIDDQTASATPTCATANRIVLVDMSMASGAVNITVSPSVAGRYLRIVFYNGNQGTADLKQNGSTILNLTFTDNANTAVPTFGASDTPWIEIVSVGGNWRVIASGHVQDS